MFILFIYLSVAQRTTLPQLEVMVEHIENTEYTPNIGQTLLLQYNNYPGVYDMKLQRIEGNFAFEMQPNTTLDPFTLDGCYPFERRLLYKELYMQTIKSEEQFFTAMYIQDTIVFITRSDNKILMMKIDFDGEQITNFSQKLVVDIPSSSKESDDHVIVCQGLYCLIFTQKETFMFQYEQSNFTKINLKNTLFPQHVHYDKKLSVMFISYGREGVDVYLFDRNGNFTYLNSLNVTGNIVEVLTNKEGSQIYILDKDVGLYIYTILSLSEFEDSGMVVHLRNAESFDFYENTFIIVAQTSSGQPYAIELFLDGEQYYFNKIYSRDMDIYDVYVGEYYAILIGAEIHKVIYHSVYNQFFNQNDVPLYFEDYDLVNVEEFIVQNRVVYTKNAFDTEPYSKAKIYYRQAFMVGISDNDISIFAIKNIFPWLQCKPNTTDTIWYNLIMNSTQCNIKNSENDYSAFTQCHVDHNFTLTGKQVLFFDKDKNLVIIIGSALGAAILLLIIAVVICRKVLQQKLRKYSVMNEVNLKLEDIQPITIPGENAIVS